MHPRILLKRVAGVERVHMNYLKKEEVMAIPSLIFRRRYVVYCPYNLLDAVDKVMAERNPSRAKTWLMGDRS